MSPENEARAAVIDDKIDRAAIVLDELERENLTLRGSVACLRCDLRAAEAECQRLRAIIAALMSGDGGRTG